MCCRAETALSQLESRQANAERHANKRGFGMNNVNEKNKRINFMNAYKNVSSAPENQKVGSPAAAQLLLLVLSLLLSESTLQVLICSLLLSAAPLIICCTINAALSRKCCTVNKMLQVLPAGFCFRLHRLEHLSKVSADRSSIPDVLLKVCLESRPLYHWGFRWAWQDWLHMLEIQHMLFYKRTQDTHHAHVLTIHQSTV